MRVASLKLKLNQPEEALKDFESLQGQVNPGSWLHQDIRARIDDSFLSRRDTAGLTKYYDHWIANHPDDIDAMMRIGRLLSIAHNSAAAKEWFARAIERAPSAVEPRLALVEALERDGSSAAAASAMQALSELKPDNPDYLVRWGELLLADYSKPEAARAAAAADVWRKLLTKNNDNPVMVARVADLMRSANLSDEAIQLYKRAVSLADGEPQYREYLGEYLHRLGRKPEAMQVWQELASGPRRNRDNLVRLSEVLGTFGYKSESLDVMGQACQLQPTFGHRLRYSERLIEAGRYEDVFVQLNLANQQAVGEDEQDLVLELEIKAHLDGNSLAERISQLEKELDNPELAKSQIAWKRLALHQEADGKTQAALTSINEAMNVAPPTAALVNLAARMQEKAGLMGDAVESLRKLIALDRRGQSRVLMQIASMQVRLGQLDKAIQTSQEMLAAADAGTEQFRYYADLCFQAGKVDQGLDALRRNMRANPNNREAIDLLARALSNNFKTDEAIELTWRSFAKCNTTSERVQVVQGLTELYLRGNAFDDLIKRLEQYGREENRSREAIQLTATAHQSSGDIASARQLLEPLVTADSRDSELITTLIELARSEGDWEAAANFQTKLNNLTPTPEGNLQLAKFLLEKGDIEQAESIWNKYASQKMSADDIQNNLKQLMFSGETDKALAMIDRALKNSPEDWEILTVCMQLLYQSQKDDKSKELAQKILKLSLPLDTLSENAKRQRSRQAASSQATTTTASTAAVSRSISLIGTPYTFPMSTNLTSTERMAMMARATQLMQIMIMERENSMVTRQLSMNAPSIVCYGDARLLALYVQSQTGESGQPKLEVSTETNLDKLWDAAFISNFSNPGVTENIQLSQALLRARANFGGSISVPASSGIIRWQTPGNPLEGGSSTLSPILKRLAELNDPEAQFALMSEYLREHQSLQSIQMGRRDLGLAASDAKLDAKELDTHLALLKKVQALPNSGGDDRVVLFSIYMAKALKAADRTSESDALVQYVKLQTRTAPKVAYALAFVTWDVDLAIDMFLMAMKQQPTSVPNSPVANPMAIYSSQSLEMSTFFGALLDRQQAVAGLQTESAAANVNRINPLRVITELKKLQAERARRMRPSQLSAYSPSTPVRFLSQRPAAAQGMGGSGGASIAVIPFPAASALQSSELLTALYLVNQSSNSLYREELQKLLEAEAKQADQDVMQSAVDHLCLSTWLWWNNRPDEALVELDAVRQTSAASDLVCMLASKMHFDRGNLKESLAQLQALKPTTAQLMQERELAILQLASQTRDDALAKQAAERLFAMRLAPQTQMQVANIMQQLGMSEMSSSMLQRLQRRVGNQLSTLQQLMTKYQREDNLNAAKEIARQILRRTRPSRSPVANQNASNNAARATSEAYRRQALQLLARDPEIQNQIQALEEKLKNTPKSTSVIYQLAELYEATGKTSEANTLLGRLQPPATKASTQATLLSRLNGLRQMRNADSVKTYLEIFEKNPALIEQESSFFEMAVQQSNAWDTVGATISQWPVEKLASQRWNSIITRVMQTGSSANINRLTKTLLTSQDFMTRYAPLLAARGRRPNLSAETNEAVLAYLKQALSDPNSTPSQPTASQASGYFNGFLSSIAGLAADRNSAKALLETIEPQVEQKPHLKCLKALLLLNAGDSQAMQTAFAEATKLPLEQNQTCLRELASELMAKNQYEQAITLLTSLQKFDSLEYSSSNSRSALLTCYEATRDFVKAKPLLDEVFASLKQASPSAVNFMVAQEMVQSGTNLAQRYTNAGYHLEALNVLQWIVSKPDMANTLAQAYGGAMGGNPFMEQVTRLETQIRDRLDSNSVAKLLRLELKPASDTTSNDASINLPDSMFIPDLKAIAENTSPGPQIATLLSRLNESQTLKTEFKQLLDELSKNKWQGLSLRSLLCAAYLADFLESHEAHLSAAQELNERLLKPVSDSQFRPACWLIAEKLVHDGHPELAQELGKRSEPPGADPRMENMHMRLRLARKLKEAKYQAASERELTNLLNELYPVTANNASATSTK